MTSRELVYRTLEFRNTDGRAPRQLWALPWAENTYPAEYRSITQDFPADITGPVFSYAQKGIAHGDPYEAGESADGWGCRFLNIQRGVHGEVKEPIVQAEDENWDDISRVHFPAEWLSFDIEEVNRFCAGTQKFVMSGCCPRPFEQLQFIRGSQQFYMDLALQPPGL
ncbi:MAG: methyltransferase, partial [Treponema sp.]|nr:methyltransferase [Treponema sp.]